MSKAKTPVKVLKTAIKRLNKGWATGSWADYDPETKKVSVCLEGAIFGFCTNPMTPQQQEALQACEQIIIERYPQLDVKRGRYNTGPIPRFNDSIAESVDDVVEVCKLAIIRLETGGPIDDDEFVEFDPDGEELMDLLPKKS